MMMRWFLCAAAMVAAVLAEAQTATAPPASGVEQSAIVPHAESHSASRAPTVERDCTKADTACNESAGQRNVTRPEEPKVPR